MPFGINGQYKMSVSIGPFKDFLTEDKFEKFTLIENIGLSVPYWELRFDCVFPELLRFLNERQTLEVQLGTGTQDLESFTLVIKKPIIVPKDSACSSVTLRGFTSMLSYLDNEVISEYTSMSSLQVADKIAKKYGLTFKSNIQNTKDTMTYYQANESDYKFLFTAWLHSYYAENDIIVPTITSNGQLKYDSIKELIVKANKLPTFVDHSPEAGELQVTGAGNLEANTTLSNLFGNYVKDRHIYDVDTGIHSHINIENTIPLISESKVNSSDEAVSKSSGFFIQSSNVHKNYYKQELVNTQKFFNLQSSRQWLSVPDRIVKIAYPGDLVMYMTKKPNGQANDAISGLYLVSKKVISISNRKVHTNFLICRENMNDSK